MRQASTFPLPSVELAAALVVGAALYYAFKHSQIADQTVAANPDLATYTGQDFFAPITETVSDTWNGTVDTFFSTVANVTGAQLSRGLRNNNPGNIRRTNTQWEGMSPTQNDPSYITFTTMIYGVRAMVRVLDNYRKRGLDTVRDIIGTWAPPNENNTEKYIQDVARKLGVGPDDGIDTADRDTMIELVHAITIHENSYDPNSDELVSAGIDAARTVAQI